MTKRSLYIIIEVIIGIIIYYILSSYIKDRALLIGAILLIGIVFIAIRAMFIANDADVLEVLINPEQFFESIKKFENRDKNRYNTLYMYGLTYTGEFDKAEMLLSGIVYPDIRTSRNLHYDYYVSKLHLLYNNKEKSEYKNIYKEAKEKKVFQKVGVSPDAFLPHLLILENDNEKAIEILKNVIPNIQKKILIIELEFILAKAYYNLNKTIDCKAICEFIIKKNHPIVYTEEAKTLLKEPF